MADAMTPLTSDQVFFVKQQFNRWLRLKEQNERVGYANGRPAVTYDHDGFSATYPSPDGALKWEPGRFTAIAPDIDHSALLVRLLEGKEPLEHPPSLRNAYPIYPGE